VESVEIGNPDWLAMPFCFHKIGVTAELEAAIDLFTAQPKRLAGGKAEGMEQGRVPYSRYVK
tara:strand:+ start:896 stop:1081 length:186 start_codon:yes stop_codon:yes gene_type:complete